MHADVQPKFDVAEKIVAFKRSLRPMRDALGRAYVEAKDFVSQAVDAIRTDAAAGRPVVPEIGYQQIKDGTVTDATRALDSQNRVRGSAWGVSSGGGE